ncbi:neuropeptide Y receptor type 2-like [Lytechinus pictus]|uniref:neuropeptide Y receptor type 2-like n=1 Tax=Lytechinus pictus TaxID=7653 RepID=UPI00240E92B1|nr:neuropeptide Y receptor type 2-like [Lytechinus pictus]
MDEVKFTPPTDYESSSEALNLFDVGFSNASENDTLPLPIPCHLPEAPIAVKGFIGLLTTIIVILGVFGNVLVCLVVIRRPKMRTVINIFICNLAISDLIYAVLGFPMNITAYLSFVWVLPSFLCKVSVYVPAVMSFVSTLTLSAIAVDRFCLVVYPLLKPINKTRCYIALAIIWLMSTSLTLPIPIFTDIADLSIYFGQKFVLCQETWPWAIRHDRKRYSTAMFLIQFFYPLLLVSIAHTCISIKLSRNVRPGMRGRDSEVRENHRRQRMNRMLSAVVIVFVVCWSPLNIFLLLHEFKVSIPCLWMMISQLIAGSSIIMNPILYAWLNDNFRKEFHRLLPFLTCLEDLMPAVSNKSTTGAVSGSNINGNLKRKERPTGATYLQPTAAESTASGATPILNTRKLAVEDTTM